MNSTWKQWGIGASAALLALSVAVGAVTTTWAQDQTDTAVRWQRNPDDGLPGGREAGGPVGVRGPGRPERGMSLNTIAEALGLTEAELRSALQSGETVAGLATANGVELQTIIDTLVAEQETSLAQAVTDGRLTQEQADARLAEYTEQLPTMLSTAFQGGRHEGGPGMGGGFGQLGSFSTIATALGISESDLRTALQEGQSVAEVATEAGADLDTVIDAIIAEQTTALTQAVSDGRLTQAQADQQLALLEANLPHLLSLKGSLGGRGGGFPGRGGEHRQPSQSPLPTPTAQP